MSYFIAETQIFSSVSKDASDVCDASWKDQEGLGNLTLFAAPVRVCTRYTVSFMF